ncbi:tyrosine-type recombinase/integrase [Streptomyces sp. NPDC056121]|uniref:tyrosine-type recombinase/integrase n=1 Tax=Streptomyces sp. NPDC056121 TaxID=3345718 RepID=UPI0035DC18E2
MVESRAKVVRCVADELYRSVEPTVGQEAVSHGPEERPSDYRVAGLLSRGQPAVRRDPRKVGLSKLGENHRSAAKYEVHVRLYLVPMLGTKRLESLSVADVRRFLNRLERESTAATAKESHKVLRSALSAACHEELITRNVVSLVEPPRVESRDLSPWSLDETLDFLTAARKDPLYAAFMLAIALGFHRGEIVGLRWQDVDLDKRVIRVRKRWQRVGGEVYDDDPKGRRRKQALPLPAICVAPLRWQRLRQAALRERAGDRWAESDYVFTTRTGRPIEPRNVFRSFTRVAGNAGLRVIRLHDARHGTATLLTAAGVAPRVVMEILGHSQIAVTMNVYTHVVQDTQREAVGHMDRLLRRRLDRE